MKTTHEFTSKLDKLTISHRVDNTIYFTEGFSATYYVLLDDSRYGGNLALQMVIHLRYKDEPVLRWGAEYEEDNKLLVWWWNKAKITADVCGVNDSDKLRKEGTQLFEKINTINLVKNQ
jgi:hypothetical protein